MASHHHPRAKVHASPQEWFRIVKKGIELGMFHPIHESLIFRDHNGQKVLNGAMAVAMRKRHEDGTETILQRFITNLIPTNSYLRRLRGDAHSLPRVGRLSPITLQDHEQLVSAFNLFAVAEQWRDAFVFEKRVPGSVVAGGDPNVLIYVSIGTVPMGWVALVDLIQQVARRIVFGMAKIPPELEVKSQGLFQHDGAWVLVYLDGLDVGACGVGPVCGALCRRGGARKAQGSVRGHVRQPQAPPQRGQTSCTSSGWTCPGR